MKPILDRCNRAGAKSRRAGLCGAGWSLSMLCPFTLRCSILSELGLINFYISARGLLYMPKESMKNCASLVPQLGPVTLFAIGSIGY